MESCPVRTALAGGAGFALGGIFGLFIASMSYDTPMHIPGSTAPAISSLPIRQQLKIGLKDMGSRSYSTAKNFAIVGTIYAGTECAIESLRARHDMYNSVSSGCITGGVLAKSAGPKAAAIGCAGFAAFSAAIDYYMNRMDWGRQDCIQVEDTERFWEMMWGEGEWGGMRGNLVQGLIQTLPAPPPKEHYIHIKRPRPWQRTCQWNEKYWAAK